MVTGHWGLMSSKLEWSGASESLEGIYQSTDIHEVSVPCKAQNWGYKINRAGVVPALTEGIASLGSGSCTPLATGLQGGTTEETGVLGARARPGFWTHFCEFSRVEMWQIICLSFIFLISQVIIVLHRVVMRMKRNFINMYMLQLQCLIYYKYSIFPFLRESNSKYRT